MLNSSSVNSEIRCSFLMVKFLILFSSCLNLIPKNGMSFKYFNALITSSFDIPSSFVLLYNFRKEGRSFFISVS